ncbi:MAG: hypothetical protein K8R40_02330 [Anaerolineaceae bacterium]|nr:hypothetical protein [Anaerolineaceae bacterium]
MKTFFIPALVEDNPIGLAKDPEYPDRLAQTEPGIADALLKGLWSMFQGQAFPQWDYDIHTCQPFEIPDNWPRYRGVDYGFQHPFVCLWRATNPGNGREYIYRELKATRWTTVMQAQNIVKMTLPDEHILFNFAGHDYWVPRSVADIVTDHASIYLENGIYLTKADVARVNGKAKIDQLLVLREDGIPGLQVFRTCPNLINLMPMLVLDETKPEDVNKMDGDDEFDTLKYVLTNMKSKTQENKKKTAKERGWRKTY